MHALGKAHIYRSCAPSDRVSAELCSGRNAVPPCWEGGGGGGGRVAGGGGGAGVREGLVVIMITFGSEGIGGGVSWGRGVGQLIHCWIFNGLQPHRAISGQGGWRKGRGRGCGGWGGIGKREVGGGTVVTTSTANATLV